VLSIRVCRDTITRRSLGYAYVNFQQPADGRSSARVSSTARPPCSQGHPHHVVEPRPGAAQVERGQHLHQEPRKNPDKSIDNKAIHDTFSTFGNILSCKVHRARLFEHCDGCAGDVCR